MKPIRFLHTSALWHLLLISLLLTACHAHPLLQGQTLIREKYQKRAYASLIHLAPQQMNCPHLDKIRILSSERIALDQPNLQDAIEDRWMVYGCGKTASYDLLFTPNPLKQDAYHYTIMPLGHLVSFQSADRP